MDRSAPNDAGRCTAGFPKGLLANLPPDPPLRKEPTI